MKNQVKSRDGRLASAILIPTAILILMICMPSWILVEDVQGLSDYEAEQTSSREALKTEPSETETFFLRLPRETQDLSADTADSDAVSETAKAETTADEIAAEREKVSLRLLRSDTGEVETLALEEYLVGVVFGEMPASFGTESLKAQAVASRTFTCYRMTHPSHENADLCDNPACCQNYIDLTQAKDTWGETLVQNNWETVRQAVSETEGQVLCYRGQLIIAAYHASSYQMTADAAWVWGGEVPYLKSVSSPEEAPITELKISAQEFNRTMTAAGFPISAENGYAVSIEKDASGRVSALHIGEYELSGILARSVFSLKSAAFTLRFDGNTFFFTCYGSGHGVGMSQYGASAYAAQGWTYRQILEHYYVGTNLTDLSELSLTPMKSS